MNECSLCGCVEHTAASYKVRDPGGSLRTFPGKSCRSCGRVQPDDSAIDWTDEVPSGLRERCEEVRSEARIKIALRRCG